MQHEYICFHTQVYKFFSFTLPPYISQFAHSLIILLNHSLTNSLPLYLPFLHHLTQAPIPRDGVRERGRGRGRGRRAEEHVDTEVMQNESTYMQTQACKETSPHKT